MTRSNPMIRLFQAIVLLLFLIFILKRPGLNNKSSDWHVSNWLAQNPANQFRVPPECDPYAEPGHLFTANNLHDSRYIIYNDEEDTRSEAPDEDWIVPSLTSMIHDHKFIELEFMRNKTILMIGDSIDRNLVTHFGRRALAGTKGYHELVEVPGNLKIPALKLESHKIGRAHLPELNFTIYNWFLMGLGVQKEVPFFHPREDLPQEFTNRLETFFLPLLKSNFIPKPDLISFNTGFWDLEYLARSRLARYNLPNIQPRKVEAPTGLKIVNLGDGNPLSLTELAYHRMRLRKFLKFLINSLNSIYPSPTSYKTGSINPFQSFQSSSHQNRPIEIMYRSMQLGNASLTNAFAAERVRQLEESNRLVLKEFGIKIIEWGKMTIGLNTQLDDPSVHYGIGSVQYIFGDMILFYLKRLVSGTKNEWIGCDWIRNRNIKLNS